MLCIIGGGKMGLALASAFTSQPDHDEVTIVEHSSELRETLSHWVESEHRQRVKITDNPVPSHGTVIAVKPKDVEIAVGDAVNAGAKRIVSVAAGIPVARLHEWAGPGVPVIRAMPNIGAMAGRSATAICGGPMVHEEDIAWAEAVLHTAGKVVRIKEAQMDAVTGLSGSGPAYVFLFAEALIDAGVQAGLPYDIAHTLAVATLEGASQLLAEEGADPRALRTMVTTPAGTTAAGLHVLEQRALRATVIDAVGAAANRSHELGQKTHS